MLNKDRFIKLLEAMPSDAEVLFECPDFDASITRVELDLENNYIILVSEDESPEEEIECGDDDDVCSCGADDPRPGSLVDNVAHEA